MFRHTIYSDKVTINAPVQVVWDFLCDLKNYPNWNPFTYQVDGHPVLCATVALHVHMPIRGDRIAHEIVQCADINETLSWGMTMLHPSLLIARRDQKLIAINSKQCTYQTWDAFYGLLTPVVVGIFGKDMLNGFNSVAYALQEHFAE
jgi:hypothetical protein